MERVNFFAPKVCCSTYDIQVWKAKLHREIRYAHSETASNIATQVSLFNAHNLTEIRQQCERSPDAKMGQKTTQSDRN